MNIEFLAETEGLPQTRMFVTELNPHTQKKELTAVLESSGQRIVFPITGEMLKFFRLWEEVK